MVIHRVWAGKVAGWSALPDMGREQKSSRRKYRWFAGKVLQIVNSRKIVVF
jgi:hypothetical protein